MEANFQNKTLSSATVRGPNPSVNNSFDPPQFLLDTTFKYYFQYIKHRRTKGGRIPILGLQCTFPLVAVFFLTSMQISGKVLSLCIVFSLSPIGPTKLISLPRSMQTLNFYIFVKILLAHAYKVCHKGKLRIFIYIYEILAAVSDAIVYTSNTCTISLPSARFPA